MNDRQEKNRDHKKELIRKFQDLSIRYSDLMEVNSLLIEASENEFTDLDKGLLKNLTEFSRRGFQAISEQKKRNEIEAECINYFITKKGDGRDKFKEVARRLLPHNFLDLIGMKEAK